MGSALGHLACDQGKSVIYHQTGRFLGNLKEAKREGRYVKMLAKIEKTDLLILEDFGLSPLNNDSRLALMDILEDRHCRKSTIIISQLPVSAWHGLIGDSTIADAIMDRIVYGSYRLELKVNRYEKKCTGNLTLTCHSG
jgi:DNA replication protein DnaC